MTITVNSEVQYDTAALALALAKNEMRFDMDTLLPMYSALAYRISPTAFRDSVSPHQLLSKYWAAMAVNTVYETAFGPDSLGEGICMTSFGCWTGLGACLVANTMKSKQLADVIQLHLVDQDGAALDVACQLAETYAADEVVGWMKDMTTMEYTSDVFASDVILNFSLEHMTEQQRLAWWESVTLHPSPVKRLVVLQATDMNAGDHVSKYESLDSLLVFNGLSSLYAGALDFGDCKRFMLIGTLERGIT